MDLWAEGRKNIFRGRLSRSNALFCLLYECTIWNSVYSCLLFIGEIHVSALIVAVYCLFRGNEIEIYGLSYFDSFF